MSCVLKTAVAALWVLTGLAVSADEVKDIATFKLTDQGGKYVLISKSEILKDKVGGTGLPHAFILPDHYCEQQDLLYIVKFQFEPGWKPGGDKNRKGLFSLGLNVSGQLPDSVSLVFLDDQKILARISPSSTSRFSQVTTSLALKKGGTYQVELRIDSRKLMFYLDGKLIGAASVGDNFSWLKGRPFYIGAERKRGSVFNGLISGFSLTVCKSDAKVAAASAAVLTNPYNRNLIGAVDGLLVGGPEYFINRINSSSNDWLFRDMANNMLLLSYCYKLPGSGYYKSPAILKYLDKAVSFLAAKRGVDDWLRRKGNDVNINRFTLVPFTGTMLRVGKDLSPETRQAALDRIRESLNLQYRNYGRKQNTVAKIYPNMDAYYTLAMLSGSILLNEPLFKKEYDRMLGLLEKAQYPDGGWPYIMTTNENTGYHEMVVAALAGIYSLNKSDTALRMLKKSVPYYKLSVGPSGIPEYVTDPFWKHNWNGLSAAGPDIVAGITGDRVNKWLADRGRREGNGPAAVYAAMFWKDINAEAMKAGYVVMDRNIEGPRGFFKDWNWVCSARYGCDTLVGCYAGDSTGQIKGLLAVRAVIANTNNGAPGFVQSRYKALGMPPGDNKGKTVISKDTAEFSSTYKMVDFKNIWGSTAYPQQWTCSQSWKLDKESIKGEIIITSDIDQQSPPPLVRLLFGKNGQIVRKSPTVYYYAPYILTVEKSDFAEVAVNKAPVSSFQKNTLNGWSMTFWNPPAATYRKGDSFRLKISLKKQ